MPLSVSACQHRKPTWFTEATIADLIGHSRGTVTSRYIHTVGTALVMAAGSIAA